MQATFTLLIVPYSTIIMQWLVGLVQGSRQKGGLRGQKVHCGGPVFEGICFSYQDSVYRSKLYSQPDYSNKDTYVPYSLEITPPLNISLPLLFAKFIAEVYLSPVYAGQTICCLMRSLIFDGLPKPGCLQIESICWNTLINFVMPL